MQAVGFRTNYRHRCALVGVLVLPGCLGNPDLDAVDAANEGASRGVGVASRGAIATPPKEPCTIVDFEKDGGGQNLAGGAILNDAFAGIGMTIDVVRDGSRYGQNHADEGLAVAFDSSSPTAGDHDLGYANQGLILISQETFTDDDIAKGSVDLPDDDAEGATFVFTFATPVCMRRLTGLDIDRGEKARVSFFDDQGDFLGQRKFDDRGNNSRQRLRLGASEFCGVKMMEVFLSHSGALDDLTFCTTAVPVVPVWTTGFDRGGEDVARGVDTDCDRRVVVAGHSDGPGFQSDGWVRQYDSAGSESWGEFIDLGADEALTAVTIDCADNPIVAGWVTTGSGRAVFVRKYNQKGQIQWSSTVPSAGDDLGLAITADRYGDIYVTGQVLGSNQDADIWVRKYAADGTPVWSDTVSNSGNDSGRGIDIDRDGNVVVVGELEDGDMDIFLRKYTPAGSELWTRTLNAPTDEFARGVVIDIHNNIALVGFRATGVDQDILVVRLDEAGNELWRDEIDQGLVDRGQGITADHKGNLFVAGESQLDGWLRKYDAQGAVVWTTTFDGGSLDVFYDVAVDRCGAIIVVGSTSDGLTDNVFIRKVEE